MGCLVGPWHPQIAVIRKCASWNPRISIDLLNEAQWPWQQIGKYMINIKDGLQSFSPNLHSTILFPSKKIPCKVVLCIHSYLNDPEVTSPGSAFLMRKRHFGKSDSLNFLTTFCVTERCQKTKNNLFEICIP